MALFQMDEGGSTFFEEHSCLRTKLDWRFWLIFPEFSLHLQRLLKFGCCTGPAAILTFFSRGGGRVVFLLVSLGS